MRVWKASETAGHQHRILDNKSILNLFVPIIFNKSRRTIYV